MLRDARSLLINLADLDDKQAITKTSLIYGQEYMNKDTFNNRIGVFQTHDGAELVFYLDSFQHAFFRSKDRLLYPDDKSIFDRSRAERIRWIHLVVLAQFDSVECWECRGYGQAFDRRIYIYWEGQYIAWLKKRTRGGYKFETAYCAPKEYLKRCVQHCRRIKIPRD